MAICWLQIRERPKIRLFIEQLLTQKESLNEIIKSKTYSKSIRTQARKMLEEQEIKENVN